MDVHVARVEKGPNRARARPALSNANSYTPGLSKIMVSLPEELLKEIDEVARQRSVSRSALLATAVRREIARPNPADVDNAITRSEQRFRTAGRFEAADLVHRDRDSRR